jgi:hypothetical protein
MHPDGLTAARVTMNPNTRRIAFIGLGAILWQMAAGSAPQSSPPGSESCRAELDDMRRLQCYDREFGSPTPVSGQRSELPQSKSQVSDDQPLVTSAPPLKRFSAKITALRFLKHGAFVATLDNGQVWAQFVAESKAGVAVGDTVTIWPGLMGSYILKGHADWLTKVHPVRNSSSAN